MTLPNATHHESQPVCPWCGESFDLDDSDIKLEYVSNHGPDDDASGDGCCSECGKPVSVYSETVYTVEPREEDGGRNDKES